MLKLFGLKFGNLAGQFGIAIAQLLTLFAVMEVNLGLDRGGAGHRRFGSNRRRYRTERKSRHVPERLKQGGSHTALSDQSIERIKMSLFL
jgi:hypothetical protein